MSINWNDIEELKMLKGDLISKYELKGLLGEGGFGKVFKVFDASLGRECALKVLDLNKLYQHDTKSREEMKKRFILEARSYARCEHPNIVPIYAFDVKDTEKDTFPYLIMRYIKGKTLRKLINRQSKLELGLVFKIGKGILSAVGYMHSNDLIHRDLKPENIMIEDGSENAILIDFGLAKDIQDSASQLTKGGVIGTFLYMSPEQLSGHKEEIGPATDVYSVGLVLYEMLSGKGSIRKLMRRSAADAVRELIKNNPGLPKGFENIMFKTLAEDPGDRYENANEFLNDIKSIEKQIGIQAEEEIKQNELIKDEAISEIDMEDDGETIIVGKVVEVEGSGTTNKIKLEQKERIKEDEELEPKRIEEVVEPGESVSPSKVESEQKGKIKESEELEPERMEKPEEAEELVPTNKVELDQKGKIKKGRELKPKKKIIILLIFIFGIMATAAFILINPFKTDNRVDPQYREFIESANKFIDSGEFERARYYLNNAKMLKETPQVGKLLEIVAVKQMGKKFEELKKFLEGGTSEKEKIAKCQEFLNQHQNIPKNRETESMVSEVNNFITQLKTRFIDNKQYQRHIEAVKKYIENGDYAKAEIELAKAGEIKNTDEVKQLSGIITKGLDEERKNGTKEYDTIKDQLDLNKYLEFKKKYPDSIHLPDLKKRLKGIDKVLPPERYWDKPIRRNKKGYYELTFGKEHNEHIMIYIPDRKFWIDKYEVSWQQFSTFLGSEHKSDDNLPALVTYSEAEKYCKQYGFKLPKESEWEYVAGKDEFKYPWGNELPDENGVWRANFESFDDGFDEIAPVNSFEEFSSPFGAVNMAGNAWEWVQGRTLKGGGFLSNKENLKIKKRNVRKDRITKGFRSIKKENK